MDTRDGGSPATDTTDVSTTVGGWETVADGVVTCPGVEKGMWNVSTPVVIDTLDGQLQCVVDLAHTTSKDLQTVKDELATVKQQLAEMKSDGGCNTPQGLQQHQSQGTTDIEESGWDEALGGENCSDDEGGRNASTHLEKRSMSMTFCNVVLDADTDPNDVPASMFPIFAATVRLADPVQQLWGATMVRKVLSLGGLFAGEEVVNAGLVPVLKSLLECSADDAIKVEAAWALAYLSKAGQVKVPLVGDGCVPPLVEHARSCNMALREPCCLALVRIGFDLIIKHDVTLAHRALAAIQAVIEDQRLPAPLNLVTEAASSFRFQAMRDAPVQFTAQVLPLLKGLIDTHSDHGVVATAGRAVSDISGHWSEEPYRVALVSSGVLPRMLQLLCHESPDVQRAAIWTVTNVCKGSDPQAELFLQDGALRTLSTLLRSKDTLVVDEVLEAISEYADCESQLFRMRKEDSGFPDGVDQVQKVVDAGLIPPMLDAMGSLHGGVRSSAAGVIGMFAESCIAGQFHQLVVEHDCLPRIVRLLYSHDTKVLVTALALLNCCCTGNRSADGAANPNPRSGFGGFSSQSAQTDSTNNPFARTAGFGAGFSVTPATCMYPEQLRRLHAYHLVASLEGHPNSVVRQRAGRLSVILPPTLTVRAAAEGDVGQMKEVLAEKDVTPEECGPALLAAARNGHTNVITLVSDVGVTASCEMLLHL